MDNSVTGKKQISKVGGSYKTDCVTPDGGMKMRRVSRWDLQLNMSSEPWLRPDLFHTYKFLPLSEMREEKGMI
jgi:hypothetical protein